MTNKKFSELFGQKRRDPENEKLTQFYMDVASSVQLVTEDIMIKISRSLFKEYKIPNLCLAGGVALNCVANGKILKDEMFKKIWIQPAAGDAGGSLGAALGLWYLELNNKREIDVQDSMQGSYLGPKYSDSDIEKYLKEVGAKFEICDENEMIEKTSSALVEGKAIGWFQGRMEFGPRALGARSIIADSRSETMQKNLNLKVKYRESFRPFAPSVIREDVADWFDMNCDSPYMLLVANVADKKCIKMTEDEKKLFGIDKLNIKRSEIPAVTHVDYSARVQTVNKSTNLKYHKLIS
jgi:carbamoyltransferase